MKKEDIKTDRYYVSITGEVHKVQWLFNIPEYEPVLEREIIGQSKNLAKDYITRFTAEYFVKEIQKEEYPEYFI